MAKFVYTAQRNTGEVYQGVADAHDRFEVYSLVRKEGAKIVEINEEGNSVFQLIAKLNGQFSTVKEYDKILFARNLGSMLVAGLPLVRSLGVLERQARSPKLKSVVLELSSSVRRGDQLNVALKKFPHTFSSLFSAMVRAGEEGGDLAKALSQVADQLERIYSLKKKIRSALIYPCVILVAIVVIGVLMMTQVVPTLASTFRDMHSELPMSTKAVIALSDFLVNNSALAFLMVVVAISLLAAAMTTQIGKRVEDFVFLRLPAIGTLVKEVNTARTARTLSSLLSAGVDVLTALAITRDVVQNSYFREVLVDAENRVRAGEPLSLSFARREDLYPPFVAEMMIVGEETGETGPMLERLAQHYENEVDEKTKDLSTIIEPILMLVIGAAVGFFAVSMISPIYSISENL